MSYSKIIQVGNLVHDPELRYSQAGKAYTTVAMATNFKYGDKDETCYIDVTFWEKAAENVNKFFKKGDPILVEGELRQDKWEKDGVKHSKHVIRGIAWAFVGGKKEEGGQGRGEASRPAEKPAAQPPAQRPAPAKPADDFNPGAYDDDIPF